MSYGTINLFKHALQKIKERKIRVEMIEEVLSNPESLFYDLIEKNHGCSGKG